MEEEQPEITATFFTEKLSLANNYFHSGLFDEAMALCVWLAAIEPGNFHVFHLWGLSFFQKEETHVVHHKGLLPRAISISPYDVLTFRNIVVVCKNKGQLGQAGFFCRVAIVIEPDNPEHYNEIGKIEVEVSAVEYSSHKHYQRAIVIRPDFADALINRSILITDFTGCVDHIRKETGWRMPRPWKSQKQDIWHRWIFPGATMSPWLNDMGFLKIHEKIEGYTLIDIYRCYELWTLAGQSIKTEGDILEVGVLRGGSGAILAQAVKDSGKKVFLADTFTGVVKAGEKDTAYKGGEHADTSEELVAGFMASLSLNNVELLKGVFPEDTQHMINGKISMVHCDVDVYQSCKDVAEWCLHRLSVGAVLVFDDYSNHSCEGVTIFCNEFKERKDFNFIYNLNGHAIFTKIA